MKSFYRMTLSEIKLFLREPMNMFFTLAFPLILLFVFGAIFGNEPAELFGGMGTGPQTPLLPSMMAFAKVASASF